MARQAQTASWKQLCTTAERKSMWDGIWKILRRTEPRRPEVLLHAAGGSTCSARESARLLADTLFPDDRPGEDTPEHEALRRVDTNLYPETPPDPPFTEHGLS